MLLQPLRRRARRAANPNAWTGRETRLNSGKVADFGRPGQRFIPRNAAIPIFCVLVGILGSETFLRTRVFKDSLTLWQDTLTKNPDSPIALDNYGAALMNEKDLDAAEAQFRRSIQG